MSNLLLSSYRTGLTVFSLGAGQDSEYGFFSIWDQSFQREYIGTNDLIIVFSHTGREKIRPPNFQSDYLFTYEGLKFLQDYFYAHKQELPFKAYFFVITHESSASILQDHGIRFITKYFSTNTLFSDKWASITTNYKRNSTIGMLHSRSRACTLNLKIMPIYRLVSDFIAHHYGYTEKRKKNLIHFANYHGKIDMLIFFTAEEKKRKFAIKLSYPLIDMNFTRESIQFAIKELGHPPIHSLSVRYMPLSDRFTIRVF